MRPASIYGAFNARWLKPEDVARSFVPTLPFKSLVRFQHSLLMGPRGSGKTTLLKMLTRRAQKVWQEERVRQEPQWAEYRRPDFEAIYVASDIRWSAELGSVVHDSMLTKLEAEAVQRALVSIAAVIEATNVFQNLAEDVELDTAPLLRALIFHLQLGKTIPSFSEIRLRLRSMMSGIQTTLIQHDLEKLKSHISDLPPSITGHALNALTHVCSIFEEYGGPVVPTRWALCFDELEIAPVWLQSELFAALRSVDQRFLLKLTWSPILPTSLTPQQQVQHDFAAIRMWHGHVADAKPFCKEFTTRYVRDRVPGSAVLPSAVFGPSPFAQEDSEIEGGYDQGSNVWQAMVRLAARDDSFAHYLEESGIEPLNPITESTSLRDETLRKVKPIVLIRDAYLRDQELGPSRRSRKNPPLYCGEDAIYAMSEGNPRLLASLLNDLMDVVDAKPTADSRVWIKPETQSRILTAASRRSLAGIKTYPNTNAIQSRSLTRVVERLGHFLHAELVTHDFKPDPVGSFFIDEDVSQDLLDELAVGLLIGAFVQIRSSDADIPDSIIGCRIRLSYMLSPAYRLVFRNFREIRLSTALRVSGVGQRSMFRFPGGYIANKNRKAE